MLEIDITFGKSTAPALAVNAALAAQGVTAIFGPSGAGKSTLLRVIAGLERTAQGQLRWGGALWQGAGHFIPPEARRIGYVFQDPRLFDHLSVLGNLRFAQRHERDHRLVRTRVGWHRRGFVDLHQFPRFDRCEPA